MAIQLQLRRGTSQEIDNFIGAESELIANAETNELTLHDGTTKGGHVVLGENRITNCITEIPQDIKLELSSGVLTLKSGSKVYIPNGTGVFDVLPITSNRTVSQSINGTHGVYVNSSQGLWAKPWSGFSSGNTAPTGASEGIWYDTANNKIEWWNGSMWTTDGGRSLPIAIVTVSGGQITSIDQVFNGFGYIGSTVFALPGVKGLIPNGRNADGTLKNTNFTVNSVLTQTFSSGDRAKYCLCLSATNISTFSFKYEQPESGFVTYQEIQNYNYASLNKLYSAIIGFLDTSAGKITCLKTNDAFHAVDYTDTEFISHQSTLSDKYIDLTPMSSSYYVAPSDGYFSAHYNLPDSDNHLLRVYATDSTDTVWLAESSIVTNWAGQYVANGDISVIIRVRKGQKVRVRMFNSETPTGCRFVYDNGTK